VIRQDAAEFIKNRDGGIPSKWDDVFLTTGASDGIKVFKRINRVLSNIFSIYLLLLKSIMEILLTNANEKPAGFMIPIPQYPFYSATIAEFDAKQVCF